MSDLTPSDGPRLGDALADRAVSSPRAARGIRDRYRFSSARDGVASHVSSPGLLLWLLDVDGDPLGEKEGEEGAAGEDSWIGEIGLLRLCDCGLAGER